MTKIQAYAAHSPSAPLEPYQYDPGPLADNHVEIEVAYCGICHSDLSMINNEWGFSQYPLVAGHEVVGSISAVGKAVSHLKVGDQVGLGWQSAYCLHCPSCMAGDHNLCGQAQGTIVGRHGGFADKVRAQAASVITLPKGMTLASAGPLFCAGITVYNPLVQFDIPATAKVAVIGIGGLGHLALQFLNAWGCEVTAFTSSEDKQKEALELGAHHTLDSKNEDELKDAGGRFDLILSTVNVPLNWSHYINTLTAKGRLHFLGALSEPLKLNIFSLMQFQRSVSSSPVGSPAVMQEMLEFAQRHNIQPKVEEFAMKDINEALAHLEKGEPRYRVVLKN